jgi:hypothetical protein
LRYNCTRRRRRRTCRSPYTGVRELTLMMDDEERTAMGLLDLLKLIAARHSSV